MMMLSDWVRKHLYPILQPLLAGLHRLGVTPNQVTFASLVLALLAGWTAANQQFAWTTALVALTGALDGMDGALARQFQISTRLGPFLDSVADHYGDFAIYLGILWFALQNNHQPLVIICFFAMFGSLVGSQIRSRAGMIGIETRSTGIFTRMERVTVLFLGFLTGWILPALVILAVAANVSALQRFIYVLRAAHRGEKLAGDLHNYQVPKQ